MNLLFDLDGTLTDPFTGITKCILHALKQLGHPLPLQGSLRWCIGPPLKNSLATLLDTDDDSLIDRALMLYRERFSTIGLFENEVYKGIPEVLQHLQAIDHTLFIATSKPTVYATRIVDHFNLRRYFKVIYGSELDGTRTDKRHLISYILHKESIPSSETVMIGDREHDMIGAKANGLPGYGVLWGYGTKAELETSGAQAFIASPRELMSTINQRLNPSLVY